MYLIMRRIFVSIECLGYFCTSRVILLFNAVFGFWGKIWKKMNVVQKFVCFEIEIEVLELLEYEKSKLLYYVFIHNSYLKKLKKVFRNLFIR